jgi:hypothetical protein
VEMGVAVEPGAEEVDHGGTRGVAKKMGARTLYPGRGRCTARPGSGALGPAGNRCRCGTCMSFLHRFGSALNHHVHLRACVTDGVFLPADADMLAWENSGFSVDAFRPDRTRRPRRAELFSESYSSRHNASEARASINFVSAASGRV